MPEKKIQKLSIFIS